MKQSRISRIVKILTTLQSGQKYSPKDLETILGISRRTVFRDLKELQSIGVPYKYNIKDGGYSIDPKFFLPPIDLNLPEALSLLMLVHKMRNHLPLPFKNSALLAGLKLENNLPPDLRQYCQATLKQTTIAAGQHNNVNLLDALFSQIQKAIKNKRKLALRYESLYENKLIELQLCPFHLLYKNRAWYVLGQSSLHNEVRMFNLGRIKETQTLDKCFTCGNNFDVNDFLGRAWQLIPEGRLYNIELKFSPKVARNVSEVQWHTTQQAKWNPDGSVNLCFRVDGLGEIVWWVLGYGNHVHVISPPALRKKVVDIAEKIIENQKKS